MGENETVPGKIEANVLVVGGGAIGGVITALMTGSVRRLAVLDTNREHVRLMRDPGLLLGESNDECRVQVEEAYADLSELGGEFDFALLTLKASHLEEAVEPLRDVAATFVPLGNGLAEERVARVVGADRVLGGTVEWGATTLGPAHVAQTATAPFVIGELDGSTRERTSLLARVLEPVAEVRVTDNIRGQIWSKLLVNSTFSALGAVSGLRYREVVADPVGRELVYPLWSEGFEVARAEGIVLEEVVGIRPEAMAVRNPEDRRRADEALETLMRHIGDVKASMLQDLERGGRTEVDAINGAVVEKGRTHGVSTPLNACLVEVVHEIEEGERHASREIFEELYPRRIDA